MATSNPLANAVNALRQTLNTAAGVTVSYTQGATTVSVTAVPGSTRAEADNGDGIIRTIRLHDFIIGVTALGVTPAMGDRIVWDGRTYEVMGLPGSRHYDEMGPYQQLYRIHAKEVSGS